MKAYQVFGSFVKSDEPKLSFKHGDIVVTDRDDLIALFDAFKLVFYPIPLEHVDMSKAILFKAKPELDDSEAIDIANEVSKRKRRGKR